MSACLWKVSAVLGIAWCGLGSTWAHKGSDAYLDVQQPAALAAGQGADALVGYRLALAVAVKDLDLLVPLDANADGKVTWGEARAAMPLVQSAVAATVRLEQPAPTQAGLLPETAACRLDWQPDGFERRGDGAYIRLVAQPRCPVGQGLALRYTLLREQDANHRLLVAGRVGGSDLLTTASPLQPGSLVLVAGTVLGSTAPAAAIGSVASSSAPSGRWATLRSYFSLGMHHLLEGYDHLAFLLALVLPLQLVLFRRPAAPAPQAHSGVPGSASAPVVRVWWALLRTITAFTIGHSITLMLATFGWTQVSPAWVEPVIALSIAVAALLNLRPVPWIRTDALALLFGLVHGFGFAGLLQEAAAPGGLLPWALAGFNLGVEAGQLAAVSAWVLLSQPLVAHVWYPRVVVQGGSVLLVLLAAIWFWQRVAPMV